RKTVPTAALGAAPTDPAARLHCWGMRGKAPARANYPAALNRGSRSRLTHFIAKRFSGAFAQRLQHFVKMLHSLDSHPEILDVVCPHFLLCGKQALYQIRHGKEPVMGNEIQSSRSDTIDACADRIFVGGFLSDALYQTGG